MKILFAGLIILFAGCAAIEAPKQYKPREGDLVFQALPLEVDLVRAIEGITRSHYSHVGVLHRRYGEWTVIEATGAGVVYTPFEKWKSIGRDERWAAYRVKAKHREHVGEFLTQLHPHAGKPYDFSYELSEDKLYCSELSSSICVCVCVCVCVWMYVLSHSLTHSHTHTVSSSLLLPLCLIPLLSLALARALSHTHPPNHPQG